MWVQLQSASCSGELFYMEHTGELPTVEEICVLENRLGCVSGGATLESGILAFSCETLTKLTETGRSSSKPALTWSRH